MQLGTRRDLRTFLTQIDSYLPAEMYCSTRATEAALFATRFAIANLYPALTRDSTGAIIFAEPVPREFI